MSLDVAPAHAPLSSRQVSGSGGGADTPARGGPGSSLPTFSISFFQDSKERMQSNVKRKFESQVRSELGCSSSVQVPVS